MEQYVVALVFSNWTLKKISDFFEDYLDAKKSDIILSKIERYKDKRGNLKDSNRTLFLMKRELFQKALGAGLDLQHPNLDFKIAEFKLNAKMFPYEGYNKNFYIIIPKNISILDCETFINEKMLLLVECGFLKVEDFSLKIPLYSRITGEHQGFAICEFSDNVDIKNLCIIRSLLHDSFIILDKTPFYFPVFWSKKYKLPPVPSYKILKKV